MSIPDGIYFGMPNDFYQAQKALGSSDHRALLASPAAWHGRKRNEALAEALGLNEVRDPEKARKIAAGKEYGSAMDVLLLDGPEAFEDLYCDDPEAPEFPKTIAELAEAIRHRGVEPPKSSAKLAEFQRLAAALGITTAETWADERRQLLAGRIPISAHWRRLLTLTRAMVDRHPDASRLLSGGRSQVSIFWTVDGLQLKARLDYLKPRPTIDLKTYAMKEGEEPITTFVRSVESYGYDVQAAHYFEARTVALPDLVGRGLVFSGPDRTPVDYYSPEDFDFIRKVARTDPTWLWVTVGTGGVPEIDVVEFPSDLMQFRAAQVQVEEARRKYREFRQRFGPDDDQMWVHDRPVARLTDGMFSLRAANRGAQLYEPGG